MREPRGARLTERLVLGHVLVALATAGAFAVLAPHLLLLEEAVARSVLASVATVWVFASGAVAASTYLGLRAHEATLRALESGAPLEPEDLGALAALPARLAIRFVVIGGGASTLVLLPFARPALIDPVTAASLTLLSITFVGTAALPHYSATRSVVSRALEMAPIEIAAQLLERDEIHQLPRRRMLNRLLVSAVAPVALVGVGAALVGHAHQRAFIERSHALTAELLARCALDATSRDADRSFQNDAIAAAAEYGFLAQLAPAGVRPRREVLREDDGDISVVTPLEHGVAVLRFTARVRTAQIVEVAVVALAAVLVAALLGYALGRTVTDDLAGAARQVRLLGTEAVLRGTTRIAQPARYRVVSDLGRGIEALAERFRVFASAQERTLEAHATAQRMRGLLFASVSHDLKGPLNSILGFAELVDQEPLTPPQRESLSLITRRGRELLGLIETILDAARVDARQLVLSPRPTPVEALVTGALAKAREVAGVDAAGVSVALAEGCPPVHADPAYVTRALALVVAHAARVASGPAAAAGGHAPSGRTVMLRVVVPPPGNRVRIVVEHPTRAIDAAELESLLARQGSERGKGLTLGLSLARSVFELHGGAIEVEGSPTTPTLVSCWLRVVPSGGAPTGEAKVG